MIKGFKVFLRKITNRFYPGYSANRITLDKIKINVAEWKGPGEQILCIHGLTANHLCFEPIAKYLSENNKHVYAIDLRGRGKSDRPEGPYGMDVHIEDIREVIEKLGLKNITLIGHSLGAFISVRLAAKYPQFFKGLVLIDGGGLLSIPQKLGALAAIKPSLARLGKEFPNRQSYMELIRSSGFLKNWNPSMEKFFSYELDESFRGVKNNINPDNIDSELISMGGSIRISRIINNFIAHPFDLIGKLKNANRLPYEDIHCPVLILRAGKKNLREGDEVLPLNALYDMMKRIKDCRAYTIPELNHFEIILSDHEERNAAILKFIDSVSSRKTTVW